MKDNWDRGRDYIARPWWRRECERLGLPADRAPEPDIGSAIRNQFGLIWIRIHSEPGSNWEMPRQRGQHRTPMKWNALYNDYGAHNLLPYDLRQAIADGTAPVEVDWWVREAFGWTEIRGALGLPEPEPKRKVPEWSPRDSLPWLSNPEATVRALRAFLTPEECLRIGELLRGEG
jgi:hypothetical protein